MNFVPTLTRVASLCLLAGSAHAATPTPPAAADSSAPVPATIYHPAAGYRPAAPEPASPERVWREQNRIVGATNSMMLTMGGADPHAGHAMPAAPAAQSCCANCGQQACCGKDGAADGKMACCAAMNADTPQSCAPAMPAPGAPAPHQHGGAP